MSAVDGRGLGRAVSDCISQTGRKSGQKCTKVQGSLDEDLSESGWRRTLREDSFSAKEEQVLAVAGRSALRERLLSIWSADINQASRMSYSTSRTCEVRGETDENTSNVQT